MCSLESSKKGRGFSVMIALAAAAVFAKPARADFVISVVGPTEVINGDSVYVLEALDAGNITGVDATIYTPGFGTTCAIVTHTEGVGGRRQVDVTGLGPDNDAYFGDATGGTFIGVGSAPLPQVPPDTYTNPLTGSQAVSNIYGEVYVNSQTSSFLHPGFYGVPATYEGNGPFDPAFTSNTVHSLEVVAVLSRGAQVFGVPAYPAPLPLANIVVPTGTPVSFQAWISYVGLGQTELSVDYINGSIPVPEPTGISVLLLGGLGLLARRRRR